MHLSQHGIRKTFGVLLLRSCLPAVDLGFGLKPVVQIVTVLAAALFVQMVCTIAMELFSQLKGALFRCRTNSNLVSYGAPPKMYVCKMSPLLNITIKYRR